jgi:putative ABC transport system substrate-binding protein
VANIGAEIGAKRFGLLNELLPGATRFAALVNPNNPLIAEVWVKDAQAAAAALGRQLEVFTASTDREIDAAFTSIAQKRIEALLVSPDNFFPNRRVQFATQAARHAVPTIHSSREYVEAGALMIPTRHLRRITRPVPRAALTPCIEPMDGVRVRAARLLIWRIASSD